MKLLGISGTITGSKTLKVVKQVVENARFLYPEIEVELLDLKQYDLQFCDGRSLETYNADTRAVIEKVSDADFYLIGTPIFQASMTGALKNLLDLIPPKAFRRKVMGFIATGGTYQHYLVIENQLKPIAGYFRTYVAPSSVYVQNDHFNEAGEIADQEVLGRLSELADELVSMHKALHATGNRI